MIGLQLNRIIAFIMFNLQQRIFYQYIYIYIYIYIMCIYIYIYIDTLECHRNIYSAYHMSNSDRSRFAPTSIPATP